MNHLSHLYVLISLLYHYKLHIVGWFWSDDTNNLKWPPLDFLYNLYQMINREKKSQTIKNENNLQLQHYT